MNAAICLVLAIAAVAVNGGVITSTHQIHDVAYHAPIVHAAPAPLIAPTILHTSSSSSYKYRAPAAKIAVAATPVLHHAPTVVHTAPSIPIFHTMNHGVLLH